VFDPKRLLEQVLGPDFGNDLRGAGQQVRNRLDGMGGTQAFTGGALAGGVLGLLLGGGTGKMIRYGGAAALGAMALQAYQNYQRQQAGGAYGTASSAAPALPHHTAAADGSPFELALVRAMIGAAKADGHIDASEQRRLFAEVERLGLDAESKAYVFDLLTQEIDVASFANAVATEEQAAELYLAARLAIDPDEPAERAYLDALAAAVRLSPGLRTRLDAAPDAMAPDAVAEGSSKPPGAGQ
jgi:uncharacterized membrane protein YebE (DUF533 family)